MECDFYLNIIDFPNTKMNKERNRIRLTYPAKLAVPDQSRASFPRGALPLTCFQTWRRRGKHAPYRQLTPREREEVKSGGEGQE